MHRAACALLACALAAHAASTLPPLAWAPLPYGTVQPAGWLHRQLRIQGDGMSGAFPQFWAPVANSTWTGGSNREGDWIEIWPYVIAGYVPQAILLNDTAQLAQSQTWIDYLLTTQAATGNGWLGPPPSLRDAGMLYWPQWPIVLTFMAWREYTLATRGAEDPRLIAGALAWLHNASAMLQTRPMGFDWSGTRWQDFTYAIQAVQDCPSTPDAEQPFLAALSRTVYEQGVKNGMDWAAWYASDAFPKDAVPSWDYKPHGVNNAMAAKGGAVSWRAGLDPTGNISSWQRDAVLMRYHGSPSGVFLADECLAGTMPSKASETCLVVEQLFSLNIVHEVQGDPFFAERAETIAYNALPSMGTKDLWSRVYLQQPNEVFAGHTHPHPWNTDGDDATTYSLQENYECCTANFNQGWPRLVQHMLHSTPDGGIALSVLGPVIATLPGGVSVNVSGDYPFDDDVTITLTGLPPSALAFPLYIRVPSWATAATLAINGAAPSLVGDVSNGTMLRVLWGGAVGPTATVTLATNPSIRVAPFYNGALSVFRGALLYSLRLDENFEVTARAALEPRVADYIVSQPGCDLTPSAPTCLAPWNVALTCDDPSHPEAAFTFTRTGVTPPVPFASGLWGASNLELTAQVRQVNTWALENNAAAPPPSSPVDCSAAGACGPPYLATFVPYGATHLRMAELPWTNRPPCGVSVAYNSSGKSVLGVGDAASFDLYGGASIEDNNGVDNIRSGNPGDVSTAAWLVMARDPTHVVTGFTSSFQYVAGYGADGAAGGATVEVVALTPGPCGGGSSGAVIATLWTSPVLSHYPFDVCATCYSPPIPISIPAGSLSLNATGGIVFALRFTDNERNLQLKLPVAASIYWG